MDSSAEVGVQSLLETPEMKAVLEVVENHCTTAAAAKTAAAKAAADPEAEAAAEFAKASQERNLSAPDGFHQQKPEYEILELEFLNTSQPALKPLEPLLTELEQLKLLRCSPEGRKNIQGLLQQALTKIIEDQAASDEDFSAIRNIEDQADKVGDIMDNSLKLKNNPGANRRTYADARIVKGEEIINDVMAGMKRFQKHKQGTVFIDKAREQFAVSLPQFQQESMKLQTKANSDVEVCSERVSSLERDQDWYFQFVCFAQWKISCFAAQAKKQQKEADEAAQAALCAWMLAKSQSKEAKQKLEQLEEEQKLMEEYDQKSLLFHKELIHYDESLWIAQREFATYQMLDDWVPRAHEVLIESWEYSISTIQRKFFEAAKLVQDLHTKCVIAIDAESERFLKAAHATSDGIEEVRRRIDVCHDVATCRSNRVEELEQEREDLQQECKGLKECWRASFQRKVALEALRKKWNKNYVPLYSSDELTGKEVVTDNEYEVRYSVADEIRLKSCSMKEIFDTGAVDRICWDAWAVKLEKQFKRIDTNLSEQRLALTNVPSEERPAGDERSQKISEEQEYVEKGLGG